MKQFVFLGLLLGLFGCTQVREEYEAEMSQWVGRSERDLFLHFGAPGQVFDVDASTRIAQYSTKRQELRPGHLIPHHFTDRNGKRQFIWLDGPDKLVTRACDLQFVLEGKKPNARVASWKSKGNDCLKLR